jgi:hypothetical protein
MSELLHRSDVILENDDGYNEESAKPDMVTIDCLILIKCLLSSRYGRQSTEGYAQGSRLSVDRCASYELDGDARQTQGFI